MKYLKIYEAQDWRAKYYELVDKVRGLIDEELNVFDNIDHIIKHTLDDLQDGEADKRFGILFKGAPNGQRTKRFTLEKVTIPSHANYSTWVGVYNNLHKIFDISFFDYTTYLTYCWSEAFQSDEIYQEFLQIKDEVKSRLEGEGFVVHIRHEARVEKYPPLGQINMTLPFNKKIFINTDYDIPNNIVDDFKKFTSETNLNAKRRGELAEIINKAVKK